MNDELDRIEAAVSRLAIAAEQLAAFQEPFVRMAAAVTGVEVPTSSNRWTAWPSGDRSSGASGSSSGGSGSGDHGTAAGGRSGSGGTSS
jgi:uncharacterized membrane protein YgcG